MNINCLRLSNIDFKIFRKTDLEALVSDQKHGKENPGLQTESL